MTWRVEELGTRKCAPEAGLRLRHRDTLLSWEKGRCPVGMHSKNSETAHVSSSLCDIQKQQDSAPGIWSNLSLWPLRISPYPYRPPLARCEVPSMSGDDQSSSNCSPYSLMPCFLALSAVHHKLFHISHSHKFYLYLVTLCISLHNLIQIGQTWRDCKKTPCSALLSVIALTINSTASSLVHCNLRSPSTHICSAFSLNLISHDLRDEIPRRIRLKGTLPRTRR